MKIMIGLLCHDTIKAHSEKTEYRRDVLLTSFIGSYYFIQALNLLIKLNNIPFPFWSIFSKTVLACMLLLCIPAIINRARTILFLSGLFVLFVYIFSFLKQNFENSFTLNYFIDSITVFLPIGICVFSISDYKLFFRIIRYWSLATHAVLYLLILLLINVNEVQMYSISIGYALLMQMLIVLDWLFQNKKVLCAIPAILDFILIILFGSRGPIVCLLVFLFLWCMTIIKNRKYRTYIFLGFIVLFPLLYFLFPVLINSLLNLSDSLGIGGRTLKKLISGSIADDSGRKAIQALCIDNIRIRPLWGWGACGGWPSLYYPHNVFIEFVLCFGIPLGILYSALLIRQIIKSCFGKNTDKKRVSFILIAYCTMLLFSGTFLSTPAFYMLIMNSFSQRSITNKSI